jgi:Tol biopolymer transport system component
MDEMRLRRSACVVALTCCVAVGCSSLDGLTGSDDDDPPPQPTSDTGVSPDAGDLRDSTIASQDTSVDSLVIVDAGPCNTSAPWGTPLPIIELNSSSDDWSPRLTSDELTSVFASARAGGPGLVSIYVATRAARLVPVDPPVVLPGPVNGTGISVHPSITGDGRTIYYQGKTTPAGTSGPDRIYRATRTNTFSAFGAGTIVPELEPLNANDYDLTPFVGSDGTRVVFASSRDRSLPDFDIYEAVMSALGTFDPPVRIATVNDNPSRDDTPVLSSDLLSLYFTSWRLDPISGDFDIYRATRSTPSGAFGVPIRLGELATTSYEGPGWVSPDGCRMYFLSNRVVDGSTGALDIFVTSKPVP